MNHTLSPGQPRDHLFDNIKALMLFLVPLGHTLDVFIADGNVEEILMKYIYLFHMPIFAFVTGYFTKNLDKARENAVKKCLIPYLVFQGLYILMAVAMLRLGLAQFNAGTFNASILLPSSAFYYLLAVFFWKLLGKSFFSFRHPLALSVALGLLISCTSYQDFHAGLGAVFSLLPFFVLGVLCTRETVERIRRIPKFVGVLILLAGSLPAVFLPYSIHSVRMTYGSVGFSNLEGIGYRVIFYVTAALFTGCLHQFDARPEALVLPDRHRFHPCIRRFHIPRPARLHPDRKAAAHPLRPVDQHSRNVHLLSCRRPAVLPPDLPQVVSGRNGWAESTDLQAGENKLSSACAACRKPPDIRWMSGGSVSFQLIVNFHRLLIVGGTHIISRVSCGEFQELSIFRV